MKPIGNVLNRLAIENGVRLIWLPQITSVVTISKKATWIPCYFDNYGYLQSNLNFLNFKVIYRLPIFSGEYLRKKVVLTNITYSEISLTSFHLLCQTFSIWAQLAFKKMFVFRNLTRFAFAIVKFIEIFMVCLYNCRDMKLFSYV